jgi:2-hydroxychromene-2-carboxylate isomerase
VPEEFARLRGDAPLAVYIDLKSPYAYLAIRPTRDMAAGVGVPIDWRPFTLDIPSYLGSAKLDRKGRATGKRTATQWSGVKYAYMDARRYANLTGLTVRGTVKIWDSSLAGIALLWAKRQGAEAFDRFVDHVYPPFWKRELDIEDLGVIEQALAGSGADVAGFREWAAGPGRQEHDRINHEAFDAGVFGVPTYLVEDELWFGREHLPRVEWLLGGRTGAPGDVENRSFR